MAKAIPVITTVALSGQQAPGAPIGAEFSAFGPAALNDNSEVAFTALLSQGTGGVTNNDDRGLWGPGSGGGGLDLIAREGSQADGAPAGALYDFFEDPVLNNSGEVAFAADLVQGSGGVTSSNDVGTWSGADGSLALEARKGSQAPGTAAGTLFSLVGVPRINASGEILFEGFLVPGTGDAALDSDRGIWGPDGVGGITVLAREGSQAPGAPAGAEFEFFTIPSFNDSGHLAFRADLEIGTGGVTSADDLGIWGPDSSGNLTMLVRKGSQAPDVPAGADFSFLGQPVLNNQDEVAFLGFLTQGSGGVTSSNDRGVWGPDGAGNLNVLVREGDSAAGAAVGQQYDFFEDPLLNDASEIAFIGRLKVGVAGVTSGDDEAIWGPNAAGNIRLIAREGDQVDGLPVGAKFGSFMEDALNDDGTVAFMATMQQGSGGVDASNDIAIFISKPNDGASIVVRTGDLLEVLTGDFRTITSLDFEGTAAAQRAGRGNLNSSHLVFRAGFSDGSSGVFLATGTTVATVPEPSTHLLMTLGLVGLAILPRRWR